MIHPMPIVVSGTALRALNRALFSRAVWSSSAERMSQIGLDVLDVLQTD